MLIRILFTIFNHFYNRTVLNFIHFKGHKQHSCFRQLYKTNYLIEWLAISHGCLWQMYQLRKKIFPIVLPSMVEAENFSDHPHYLIEWLATLHGCLWQMYQLRKIILPIVLPSMVEAENFSDHPLIVLSQLGRGIYLVGSKVILCLNSKIISTLNVWEMLISILFTIFNHFYNRTILNFIHFEGYRQHSYFSQLYKTTYLIEWLAISHGCLWQMYQLRKKIYL